MIFLIALAGAAFLAAAIAPIVGFGIGSILTPLLALRLDMKTAVAVVAIPHFTATALRFWHLRRDVDRRILLTFGIVNAAGALAGALLHSVATGPALRWLLAALLMFAGLLGLFGYAERLRFGPKTAWAAGLISGAFGGLVGNQGGIRAAAMLGLSVKSEAFVATATAIGLLVDLARLPVYLATEASRMLESWPFVCAALLGVIAGTVAGERILRRIPAHLFRRVVSVILLAIGVFLLLTSPK